MVPLAQPSPREEARFPVVCEGLLDVDAEAVLRAARLLVGQRARARSGGPADGHGLPVVAHVSLVVEREETDDRAYPIRREVQLDVVPPGMVDLVVEVDAVPRRRHLVAPEDQPPRGVDDGNGGAYGVTPRIGGVIPGRIEEEGVVEELRPPVIRVAVLVEIVRGRELACLYLDAVHRLAAGELVHAAGQGLTQLSRQRDDVARIQAGKVGVLAEIRPGPP